MPMLIYTASWNWCYAEFSAGYSSGSLSPGGKLQLNLQDANPTLLSNEAVENAKNDEIFGGESEYSIVFFIFLTKSLPFLSAGVESVGCAWYSWLHSKRQPFVMGTIGFPL